MFKAKKFRPNFTNFGMFGGCRKFSNIYELKTLAAIRPVRKQI